MGKGTEDAKARGGNGKSTGKGDQGEGDVLVAVIGNRNRTFVNKLRQGGLVSRES